MKSKAISGSIALAYLTIACFAGGGELAGLVAASLVLPLACIWFSDALGEITGARIGHASVPELPRRPLRLDPVRG